MRITYAATMATSLIFVSLHLFCTAFLRSLDTRTLGWRTILNLIFARRAAVAPVWCRILTGLRLVLIKSQRYGRANDTPWAADHALHTFRRRAALGTEDGNRIPEPHGEKRRSRVPLPNVRPRGLGKGEALAGALVSSRQGRTWGGWPAAN